VGAFGEKLRQRREQRGISLDAISATTKISTRMLRAIEDEHFDQLPGGVFNKGFVRAYARHVGLDEEEAVSDYLAALRESQIQSQAILPNFRDSSERLASRVAATEPAKSTVITPDVSEKEAIAKAQLVERKLSERREAERKQKQQQAVRPSETRTPEESADSSSAPLSFLGLSNRPVNNPTVNVAHQPDSPPYKRTSSDSSPRFPWERLATALLAITLVFAFWAFRRRSHAGSTEQVAANQVSLPISNPTTNVTDAPRVAPSSATSASVSGKSPVSLPPTQPTPDVKSSATTSTEHVAKPKPPPTFTLQIRASETSWISIMVDGQPGAKETLIAPANTSVRAAHEIVVHAGNSGGISFLLNGKDIPGGGNEGEIRVYRFDATGLQSSDLAQPANPTN